MGTNTFLITISAADKASDVVNQVSKKIGKIVGPLNDVKKSSFDLGKEKGLAKTGKAIWAMGEEASSAALKIADVIAPMASLTSAGSVAGLVYMTKRWGDLGGEISRTSSVLGMSAEDLQRNRKAAVLAGISAEAMTGSMRSLGQTMRDAQVGKNTGAWAMMNQIGLQLKRTKDGSVDTLAAMDYLFRYVDKNKGIMSVQALQEVTGTFGMSDLLPLMLRGEDAWRKYRDEVDKTNSVMNNDAVKAADAFRQSVDKLGLSFEGLWNKISQGAGTEGSILKTTVDWWAQNIPWLTNEAIKIGRILNKTPSELAPKFVKFMTTDIRSTADDFIKEKAENLKQDAAYSRKHPGGHFERTGMGSGHWVKYKEFDAKPIQSQLQGLGWTPAQATGIAANISRESGGNPGITGDSGKAYGIAQWHPDRQANFARWAGKDIRGTSLSEQVAFIDWELRNTEKEAGDRLRQTTTPGDAAAVVSQYYERPGAAGYEARRRAEMATAMEPGPAVEAPYAGGATAQGGSVSTTQTENNGSVKVDINFNNAPPGMQSTVQSQGPVTPSTKIGWSMPGVL